MSLLLEKVYNGEMALRKNLFKSPANPDDQRIGKTKSEMETLLNKIQVEIEVENNLNIVEKELHEKRLTKMREEVKALENDDWMHRKITEYVSF